MFAQTPNTSILSILWISTKGIQIRYGHVNFCKPRRGCEKKRSNLKVRGGQNPSLFAISMKRKRLSGTQLKAEIARTSLCIISHMWNWHLDMPVLDDIISRESYVNTTTLLIISPALSFSRATMTLKTSGPRQRAFSSSPHTAHLSVTQRTNGPRASTQKPYPKRLPSQRQRRRRLPRLSVWA
ncbi:hypothetical protein P154DRAFT_211558 [Amniculicola lignicola CBS 123094]|uniref:Uncharacterized protein n=1 Tax=Amniculicola lignicola CBS 123094 TaxID=1392246 RepID=A0A6A5WIF4_9PLEO|nr:hypothetical protein P154DRAFT_211558 [Amniculicola lignicola CBS 123094]